MRSTNMLLITAPATRTRSACAASRSWIVLPHIEARAHAGLTQEQLAERMHTTQAVIPRLENGRIKPSTRTLERLAVATVMRLRISFEPAPGAGELKVAERRLLENRGVPRPLRIVGGVRSVERDALGRAPSPSCRCDASRLRG